MFCRSIYNVSLVAKTMNDLTQVELVGFDLDGTLIRNDPDEVVKAVMKSMGRCGANGVPTREDVLKLWYDWSLHGRGTLEKYGIDFDDFWNVHNGDRDTLEFRGRISKPYDDVGELERLKDVGKRLVIITSTPRYLTELEVEMLPKVFDSVVCARPDEGYRFKPDPSAMIELRQKYSIGPKRSLFCGNGREDVGFGNKSGSYSVLIDRGEYMPEGVNPNLTITSLKDLVDRILGATVNGDGRGTEVRDPSDNTL